MLAFVFLTVWSLDRSGLWSQITSGWILELISNQWPDSGLPTKSTLLSTQLMLLYFGVFGNIGTL